MMPDRHFDSLVKMVCLQKSPSFCRQGALLTKRGAKRETKMSFYNAYNFTQQWEAGYRELPLTKGGPTNKGVSLGLLQTLAERDRAFLNYVGIFLPVSVDTVKAITSRQAALILQHVFWDAENLDDYPDRIAAFLFDCSVQFGWRTAVRLAKHGYNSTLGPYGAKLPDNGTVDLQTRNALSMETDKLIACCLKAREDYCQELARETGANAQTLKAWLRRTRSLRGYLRG